MCKWFHPKPKPPVPPVPPVPPTPPAEPKQRVFAGVYDFLGATGDWRWFLEAAKGAGASGLRFFVCFSWQGPQPVSPYQIVGTFKHDNGMTFPLYRLSAWNEDFWTLFANVLAELKRHGMTAWVVMEDFCSLKGDSTTKYYNPMICSEEALGPDTPGGVWGDGIKPFHEALFKKVVGAVKASGVTAIYEIMNEYDALDWSDDQMVAWNDWAVGVLTSNGVLPGQIIASPGRCVERIIRNGIMYSPHQIGRADQVVSPMAGASAARIIYSSDGVKNGEGGADAHGGRGVGVDEAKKIGVKMHSIGAYGFDLLPRELYGNNQDRAELGFYDSAPTVAMAWAE